MLSIIIPIYNIIKYLPRCLESIAVYVKYDYEVILVDDGSTDDSGSLCDEYAERYANISVVHKPNAGVSAARNAGIEKAKGDWIWFVDGDDYIEQPVDVTAIDANSMLAVMGCIWEEKEVRTQMPASSTDIPYNTWRCLFRRDMIVRHKIRFTVGRSYAEDQEFILKYLLVTGCNDNLCVIRDNVYHYTVRPNSAITAGGRKFVMLHDIFFVICSTVYCALCHGLLFKGWFLKELKRLAKTLFVTITR